MRGNLLFLNMHMARDCSCFLCLASEGLTCSLRMSPKKGVMWKQVGETLVIMNWKIENEGSKKGNKGKAGSPILLCRLAHTHIVIFASVLPSVRFAHVPWCVTCSAMQISSTLAFTQKKASCRTLALSPKRWLLHQGKHRSNCSAAVKCSPKRNHTPRGKEYDFQW